MRMISFIKAVGKTLADKLLTTINAVVTPIVAAFSAVLLTMILGVAVVGTANTGSHLPDCQKDSGCLLQLKLKWFEITPNELQAMINSGANVNAKGYNGATPLHAAAGVGNAEVIPVLVQAGADVNAKVNNTGSTPLYFAAQFGRVEVIPALVKAGANVNAKADKGFTPLHAAAGKGNTEMISVLIKVGADVNAKAKFGVTPLDIAKSEKHWNAVKLLKKYGAK